MFVLFSLQKIVFATVKPPPNSRELRRIFISTKSLASTAKADRFCVEWLIIRLVSLMTVYTLYNSNPSRYSSLALMHSQLRFRSVKQNPPHYPFTQKCKQYFTEMKLKLPRLTGL